MKKPYSLRQYLTNGVKFLQDNPDKLTMFIERGHYRCLLATGYSMESICPVKFIIQDFTEDPDIIAFLLFQWLKENQSELMANLEKNKTAVKFEAEMIDNDKTDIMFEVELTERIIIKKQNDGSFNFDYPSEPQYTTVSSPTKCQLLDGTGELLAEWTSIDGSNAVALETPIFKQN
ncbi:phage tail protein [Acinetobacter bereziniae]|nr:phage tail protein [Acinetobacter bereziniae]MBJ8475339.1 phage tail protein [Acinetobacter bereziniae]